MSSIFWLSPGFIKERSSAQPTILTKFYGYLSKKVWGSSGKDHKCNIS